MGGKGPGASGPREAETRVEGGVLKRGRAGPGKGVGGGEKGAVGGWLEPGKLGRPSGAKGFFFLGKRGEKKGA